MNRIGILGIRTWLGVATGGEGGGTSRVRHVIRWLAIGAMIGVAGGLGAIMLNLVVGWTTSIFLGFLVDFAPPVPAGEGSTVFVPAGRPWLLPLVTALGGLAAGAILYAAARDVGGHGTDAVITAIHQRQGHVSIRLPFVALMASSLTIGAGGSAGRGGPAAQIAAGLSAGLGRWLKLSPADQKLAVAAGLGAGFGAIFRAPFGGGLVAAEVLYVRDLEVQALLPAVTASLVAHLTYGTVFGFSPLFGEQTGFAVSAPVQLLYYGMLGVLAGVCGRLYAGSLRTVTGIFRSLRLPVWLKPAIGGLLVGSLGLLLPGVLHVGYGWTQLTMGPMLLDLPLWVVVLLPFAKIAATALSLGSGGSGGTIGPGLVIGGMVGGSFWRLAHGVLPDLPATPAPFVIVGMMALFGAAAHAPLGVMVMVAEMTDSVALLAPAAVALAVAVACVRDTTIFRGQVVARARPGDQASSGER